MAAFFYLVVTFLGVLGAWIYAPVKHNLSVLGVLDQKTGIIHGVENRIIPDTIACEDLEYHAPSGMLYTACNGNIQTAAGWMPGAGSLEHPETVSHGTIVVIDPQTFKSQKLSLKKFKGPFSTHGIGLYTDPRDPKTVFIFAINHLPNPKWTPGSTTEEKAASQVELFTHKIGSKTATHVRSIKHPLIRTPNDLIALSTNEFLITNDHRYRDGVWRLVEEFLVRPFTSWTDTVHVKFIGAGADSTKGVEASIALDSIETNNGLTWGPEKQVVIGDAVGGNIYFAELPASEGAKLNVTHRMSVECVVDNAAYFADPYAGLDGKDYSGYLLPGLSRGITFHGDYADPTGQVNIPGRVWYLPKAAGQVDAGLKSEDVRKLIFSDDGATARGPTTAILVAIDPATNEGKREGWLYVTGVIAHHILATRIDFETVLA
ncbi:serum paraoxonase/arylesterase family protein [Xylariaceae sp. FL0255]|nr:serum paraoxonase/arylesterase family protein [Xylariaceae sp. FL0255]